MVLEFDNLLYEGSTCCWLVYPGLSSAFVMGRLFCRFYRGMMSLPDVKEPLFVADGLCRRMFCAVMMGFFNLCCFRGLSDAWIVYVPCV